MRICWIKEARYKGNILYDTIIWNIQNQQIYRQKVMQQLYFKMFWISNVFQNTDHKCFPVMVLFIHSNKPCLYLKWTHWHIPIANEHKVLLRKLMEKKINDFSSAILFSALDSKIIAETVTWMNHGTSDYSQNTKRSCDRCLQGIYPRAVPLILVPNPKNPDFT